MSTNPDGNEYVYAINMASLPGWNGVITRIVFMLDYNATANTSQSFIASYIGKTNQLAS